MPAIKATVYFWTQVCNVHNRTRCTNIYVSYDFFFIFFDGFFIVRWIFIDGVFFGGSRVPPRVPIPEISWKCANTLNANGFGKKKKKRCLSLRKTNEMYLRVMTVGTKYGGRRLRAQSLPPLVISVCRALFFYSFAIIKTDEKKLMRTTRRLVTIAYV